MKRNPKMNRNTKQMVLNASAAVGDIPSLFRGKMFDYIDKADTAHNRNHIIWVLNNATEILDKHPEFEEHRNNLMMACFCHDIGCFISRENHHEESAKLFLKEFDEFNAGRGLNVMRSPECRYDRDGIASAILKHRASYKGERTTVLEELVAAADRGKPNWKGYAYRCFMYTQEKHPEASKEQLSIAVFEHMVDKYGKDGYAYANAPKFWLDLYKDEIAELKELAHSKEATLTAVHMWFNEEVK